MTTTAKELLSLKMSKSHYVWIPNFQYCVLFKDRKTKLLTKYSSKKKDCKEIYLHIISVCTNFHFYTIEHHETTMQMVTIKIG